MRKSMVATLCALASCSLHASTGGNIVFDPTNFAKNTLTAAATVKTEISTAMTQLNTLKQLLEMIRQAQAIGRGDLQAIGAITNQQELVRLIQESQSSVNALRNLDVNLGNVQGRYDYLMNISSRYGVSLETYLAQREVKAKEGVRTAQVERDRDLNTLKDTKKTLETVQKLGGRVLDNNMKHYETMNEQLAVLNTSMTKILESSAHENIAKTKAEDEKKAEEAKRELERIASLKERERITKSAFQQSEDAVNAAVSALPARK